jgi:prophage lp2 protein 24|nr:MAG TPA: crossover junction endodeoxyribonuclease [Caudoviricetes sp.]
MISFTIKGNLAGLNELIAANRKCWATGNKLKRKNMDMVKAAIYEAGLRGCKCREPVGINFYWYEKNKKRDKDNIASAKKYILDAMIEAGLIRNDGWKNVEGFKDRFDIDKDDPKVMVLVFEAIEED